MSPNALAVLALILGAPPPTTSSSARPNINNSGHQRFVRLADPPLAKVWSDRMRQGRVMTRNQQRTYTQKLLARQAAVRSAIGALPGLTVHRDAVLTLNGFVVTARDKKALERLDRELEAFADVAVLSIPTPTFFGADAKGLLELGAVFADQGYDGTGVSVGIIDSGIDYLSASLGGPGESAAYEAQDPDVITDVYKGAPLFPTSRVVGGYDFVNDDRDPMPDDLSSAAHRHGTSVAHVVGGSATEGIPSGMAPGVELWALKVAVGVHIIQAIEWAMDPNGDGDISDRLDILSASWGYPFGNSQNNTLSAAIQGFIEAGGVFVAATGNTGDRPFSVAYPANLPGVIAVGASHHADIQRATVDLTLDGATDDVITWIGSEGAPTFTPRLADIGPIAAEAAYVGPYCAGISQDLQGRIAIIEQAGCSMEIKLLQAVADGAVAALVLADSMAAEVPITPTLAGLSYVDLPFVLVGAALGDQVRTWVNAGQSLSMTLSSTPNTAVHVDTVASYSARGPATAGAPHGASSPLLLKPDLVGPAGSFAAQAGAPGQSVLFSGTSSSTAAVAGALAVLKQARPSWDAVHLKAVLMNTAQHALTLGTSDAIDGPADEVSLGGGPAAPQVRVGAGRPNMLAALQAEVVAYVGASVAANFGYVEASEPETLTASLTLENLGDSSRMFDLAVDPSPSPGVSLSVSPATVSIGAGALEQVVVEVTIEPTALAPWSYSGNRQPEDASTLLGAHEFQGSIVATDPSQTHPTLRVPFYGLVRAVGTLQVAGSEPVCSEGGGSATGVEAGLGTRAQVFSRAWEHPFPEAGDATTIAAVGVRKVAVDGESVYEFAVARADWSFHSYRQATVIALHREGAQAPEFLLGVGDFDYLNSDGDPYQYQDRQRVRLYAAGDANLDGTYDLRWNGEWDIVSDRPAELRVASAVTLVSAPSELLDASFGEDGFYYRVHSVDRTNVVDFQPQQDFETVSPLGEVGVGSLLRFQPSCSLFEGPAVVETDGAGEPGDTLKGKLPSCRAHEDFPPGLMFVVEGVAAGFDEWPTLDAERQPATASCNDILLEADPETCREPGYSLETKARLLQMAPCQAVEVVVSGPELVVNQAAFVNVLATDARGEVGSCQSQVRLVDVTGPQVTCGVDVLIAGVPTALPVQAFDACGPATTLERDVVCTDEQSNVVACPSPDPVTGARTFTGAGSVQWTAVAIDTTGNEASAACVASVQVPSGGCAGGPTGGPAVWGALVMLAALARRKRRARAQR